jgi:2-amino-4-hydroxy-6-hydroxymethyldihydropteridine diphosphokinase
VSALYLSLGTNLGDKEQNLRRAAEEIEKQIGKITSLSAFYVTAPWGFESGNSFLNAAACVETTLSPIEVLKKTQEIERTLGRAHKSVDGIYSDRLIDIDLLLYDDLTLHVTTPWGDTLILPHPLMTEREFVMKPLAEIAPGEVMERMKKTD